MCRSRMREDLKWLWMVCLCQGGAKLAVDTTLVCALHADGRPRLDAAKHDGVALKVARRKSTVYPELVGPHNRAKLVVLAAEVGVAGRRRVRGLSCHSRDVERSKLGV